MPSNVLPLHLKQTFPTIIWIFTEGEDDWIESGLSSEIFSTLTQNELLLFDQLLLLWPRNIILS